MPDEIQVEHAPDAPPTHPAELQERSELSEQELDNVSGGGAQPHMLPPGPCAPTITHD